MKAGLCEPLIHGRTKMKSVEITVTFTDAQAWEFAQFLKRVSSANTATTPPAMRRRTSCAMPASSPNKVTHPDSLKSQRTDYAGPL
jgi:hypothetical protein